MPDGRHHIGPVALVLLMRLEDSVRAVRLVSACWEKILDLLLEAGLQPLQEEEGKLIHEHRAPDRSVSHNVARSNIDS